jgi:iron complex transport system ATP-binding protein
MSENKENSILAAENLTIGYHSKNGDKIVSNNLNFQLAPGKLIGLVGANGIGKSTLIRTLSNMQAPLSGKVLLNGQSIESFDLTDLAQEISLVLTEPLSTKNLSIQELVALGRHPYTNWIGTLNKTDQLEVEKAMELMNLIHLKDRKCYELSDGQLQKALIARALAQDTKMIILDEPTTHLDMYHKAYLLKLLKDLTLETGKTILFSSHEIDLAIQLCDTMLVMTSDTVYCDHPCLLIEQNVFETLFPKDLITFDRESGSFKINK